MKIIKRKNIKFSFLRKKKKKTLLCSENKNVKNITNERIFGILWGLPPLNMGIEVARKIPHHYSTARKLGTFDYTFSFVL